MKELRKFLFSVKELFADSTMESLIQKYKRKVQLFLQEMEQGIQLGDDKSMTTSIGGQTNPARGRAVNAQQIGGGALMSIDGGDSQFRQIIKMVNEQGQIVSLH